MQSINKKPLIILAVGITAVILFLFGLSRLTKQEPNEGLNANVTSYYDADSGQTVTDVKGKTPELAGGQTVGPTYLGFFELIDKASMTQDQLNGIQIAFNDYASKQKIKEISLKVDTITVLPINPDEAKSVVEFQVKFDRKPVYYKTSVESVGLSQLQVRLYDSSGALVFDSGIVNGEEQAHD